MHARGGRGRRQDRARQQISQRHAAEPQAGLAKKLPAGLQLLIFEREDS